MQCWDCDEACEIDYEFVTYKWPNWLHTQVGVVLRVYIIYITCL